MILPWGDHLCLPQALAQLLIAKSDEKNTSFVPALKMIGGTRGLAEVVCGTRVPFRVCLSPRPPNHNAAGPQEALGVSPVWVGLRPLM